MINLILALTAYIFIFLLLFISITLGYRFGIWRRAQNSQNHLGVVKVAEGTVFALLGLLVAFSFSGAYERFENRKLKIIDEISAIQTAFDRVDLLAPAVQADMRTVIQRYGFERVAIYKQLAEFHGFQVELDALNNSQEEVWAKTVAATRTTNDTAVTLLFIQSITNMFEMGGNRMLITRIHPPIPIFVLLIGLAAISAFLAGYSMAKNQHYSRVYALCFIAITALTLYVIIDLEFPRIGMIRVDNFDHLLEEAVTSMNKN